MVSGSITRGSASACAISSTGTSLHQAPFLKPDYKNISLFSLREDDMVVPPPAVPVAEAALSSSPPSEGEGKSLLQKQIKYQLK
jgi:hypothetical protein